MYLLWFSFLIVSFSGFGQCDAGLLNEVIMSGIISFLFFFIFAKGNSS